MARSVLLVALALSSPWPARAQPSAPAAPLASYLQLAARYRGGQTVAAAYTLGTWPRAEVLTAVRMLSTRFTQAAPADPEAVDLTTVEAAVLMHTDAAASAYAVGDGAAGDFHLSNAQSLVNLIDDTSAQRASTMLTPRRVPTKDWLLVVGSIRLQLFALDDAEALYRRALTAAPDDPQVLLALGGYYEVRHWHEAFSLAMRGRQPVGSYRDRTTARMLDGMRVTNNLNEAAKYLARAIAVDAGQHEARLRLARVEMLRGKREDSERLLAQVAAEGQDRALRYLVALFSARLRDTEGAHEAALGLYRQAAQLFPSAQTARMGLAQALERKGAVDEAREALGSLPPPPKKDEVPQDPWWVYRLGYVPRAAALLERLRGAVRTP
jgi:tetratricopeptide (TPR) repeat protein